ncbi:2OG-Fe(II) oxygenase superfamily protein [Sarocladium implicatum]|nr:2OG-Fe(II) oxygenase superfamily protein [Sarocladium implicatum]
MSKTKSKKKRQAQAALVGQPTKIQKLQPTIQVQAVATPDDVTAIAPKALQSVIHDDDLEITVDTLSTLSKYPNLIKSKACKDLRVAVYDFRQASTVGMDTTTNANLTARITAALTDEKYTEARILLAEMKIRAQEPKVGSLCRWVRDLDVISGLSTIPEAERDSSTVIERSPRALELLQVIDAILRVVGPVDENPNAVSCPSSPMVLQEIWNLRPSAAPRQTYASVLDKTIFESAPPNLDTSVRVIETTPGAERKPPNHHPAILYTTSPNAVRLSSQPASPISHTPHPHVPGLSLATNLLSPEECQAIIAAGETVNFVPDAPLREDGDISILAHNFYWVVDQEFHDLLWSRIKSCVPKEVEGRPARGLNRRFRVYRYVPGAEYRAHIDGAWPPSGILEGDKYVYDDSPPGKKQSSLFTFLIYLNDDFEGGETTFFLPAAREGTLNAYPVKPVMGAVAMFPHGETRGALLHEGTGVRKGAKYIIRTDVEYDVEA